MILTEVIMVSRNSMASSSWLLLPSTRSLTTKTHELNVFRHVENIKETLMSTTITTAYHILVEEKFNQSDTSCQTCQRPPWSSPPSYPPRPRCRWPPTHMYLWSVMLSWKHKKNSNVTLHHNSISRPCWTYSNASNTSYCQRPPWSSPPSCPCRARCRRAPTLMYLMLMLKT